MSACLALPRTSFGTYPFVYDNTVCQGSCKECSAIAKASPCRVVVEGDIGQAVSESAEKKRDMASKPSESERT